MCLYMGLFPCRIISTVINTKHLCVFSFENRRHRFPPLVFCLSPLPCFCVCLSFSLFCAIRAVHCVGRICFDFPSTGFASFYQTDSLPSIPIRAPMKRAKKMPTGHPAGTDKKKSPPQEREGLASDELCDFDAQRSLRLRVFLARVMDSHGARRLRVDECHRRVAPANPSRHTNRICSSVSQADTERKLRCLYSSSPSPVRNRRTS